MSNLHDLQGCSNAEGRSVVPLHSSLMTFCTSIPKSEGSLKSRSLTNQQRHVQVM